MDDVLLPTVVGVVAGVVGYLLWRRLADRDEATERHFPRLHRRKRPASGRPDVRADRTRLVADGSRRAPASTEREADELRDRPREGRLTPIGPGPPTGQSARWPVEIQEIEKRAAAGADTPGECPRCGLSRANGAAYCMRCGRRLSTKRRSLVERLRSR